MTRDEVKTKLDALSPETKEWLTGACDQIADCGEYVPNNKARAECVAAGLVEIRGDEFMHVKHRVMNLVYSDGYLRPATPLQVDSVIHRTAKRDGWNK